MQTAPMRSPTRHTVVFLDADTLVLRNSDDLFLCDGFCAAMRHSERFNSGVVTLQPSAALFAEMMDRIKTTPSYDGGDQGFLNSFFEAFKEAPFFDPRRGKLLSATGQPRVEEGVRVRSTDAAPAGTGRQRPGSIAPPRVCISRPSRPGARAAQPRPMELHSLPPPDACSAAGAAADRVQRRPGSKRAQQAVAHGREPAARDSLHTGSLQTLGLVDRLGHWAAQHGPLGGAPAGRRPGRHSAAQRGTSQLRTTMQDSDAAQQHGVVVGGVGGGKESASGKEGPVGAARGGVSLACGLLYPRLEQRRRRAQRVLLSDKPARPALHLLGCRGTGISCRRTQMAGAAAAHGRSS